MKPRRDLPLDDTPRTVTVTYAVRDGWVVPILISVSDTPQQPTGGRIFRGVRRKDYQAGQDAKR